MIHTFTFPHSNCTATLMLGDCIDLVPTIGTRPTALISDPPYGMDWDTDSTRFSGNSAAMEKHPRGKGRSTYAEIEGDSMEFDPAPWIEFPKCVLFGMNHFAAKLPTGTSLVWVKKAQHLWGTFLSDAEIAWMKGGCGVYLFFKSFPPPARAIDYGGSVKNPTGIHPTQKPVALMAWCMDRAKVEKGETVLDPYMGSGSTGIACVRTGRNFIGIEKHPQFFDAALQRFEREAAPSLL